jgi:hypothetical protein
MGKMPVLSDFSRKWLIFSVLQPNFTPKTSKVKPPILKISAPTSKVKAPILKIKPLPSAVKVSISPVSAPTSKISASTSGNSHLMPPVKLWQLGINSSSQLTCIGLTPPWVSKRLASGARPLRGSPPPPSSAQIGSRIYRRRRKLVAA